MDPTVAFNPPPLFGLASRLLANSPLRHAPGLSSLAALPAQALSMALGSSVSLVLNHLIDQQRTSKTKLQREAGKVLAIKVSPVQLQWRINDQGYFQVTSATQGVLPPSDTEIALQWADLMGSVANPGSMVRKASVTGDMEFAQVVSQVVNDLSWDPERDLARVVGDAQAVWIMNSLSAMGTNVQDVVARFKSSLREYVVHEKSMAPTASEFDAFRADVGQLRDEIARLEKRLARLSPQTQESSRGQG